MNEKTAPRLYSAEQSRAIDRLAIEHGADGYQLMQEAANAAFALIRSQWPDTLHLHIICGTGNNGGDGLVLARLAQQNGYDVSTYIIGDSQKFKNEALDAYLDFKAAGLLSSNLPAKPIRGDKILIIDALLGTGVRHNVRESHRLAIEWINRCDTEKFAIDVPSGLCSNTGQVLGAAVQANKTLSFIARKIGLYQSSAKALCGELYFDSLNIPPALYHRVGASHELLSLAFLRSNLKQRAVDAHKGNFGHVLIIGGNYGYAGAVLMAGEACARMGAGLTSILTRPEHIAAIVSRQPEIMAHGIGIDNAHEAQHLIASASHIIIGPGLGQDEWARDHLYQVVKTNKPIIFDADALNLIADDAEYFQQLQKSESNDWIFTPHPGEAARLLQTDNQAIQADRSKSLMVLHQHYKVTCLLKGASSLICHDAEISLCHAGNPYMATGGMGDVLSGFIGGMMAQGLSSADALKLAVSLHAEAADKLVAEQGGQGLLATDLIANARYLLNQTED